jgi:N-acetylglucosamine-6-sulfatase
MALMTDLAPTFAAWAGVEPPDFVDGRSLAPLLADRDAAWRHSFVIQRLGLESDERMKPANALAIRTAKHAYIAYNDGEGELYDLEKDPGELQNLERSADPALIETLLTRLTELRACRGQDCRDIEDKPID